jgi:hypothetical protein
MFTLAVWMHGLKSADGHQVHPLRIQKGTPLSSPVKMGSGIPRPLSELAPTEKRRNSPSFNQATKVYILEPVGDLKAYLNDTEDDAQWGLVSIPIVSLQRFGR